MDDFDVTPMDGLVELALPFGIAVYTSQAAERLGCALLRAAGVADMADVSTDDDEAGTPLVVTADEEPAF